MIGFQAFGVEGSGFWVWGRRRFDLVCKGNVEGAREQDLLIFQTVMVKSVSKFITNLHQVVADQSASGDGW